MNAPRWIVTRSAGLDRWSLVVGAIAVTVYQLAGGDPWYLDVQCGALRATRRAHCRDAADARRWALLQALPLAESVAEQAAADAQGLAELLRETSPDAVAPTRRGG